MLTTGVKGRKQPHSSSPFCPQNLTISCKFRQNRKQCFLFQSWDHTGLSGLLCGEQGQGNSPVTHYRRQGTALPMTETTLPLRVTRVSPFISQWRAFLYILDYSPTSQNIYSLQWRGKQAYSIDADLTRPRLPKYPSPAPQNSWCFSMLSKNSTISMNCHLNNTKWY